MLQGFFILACATCYAPNGASTGAYILATLLLSLLPFAFLGVLFRVIRSHKNEPKEE